MAHYVENVVNTELKRSRKLGVHPASQWVKQKYKTTIHFFKFLHRLYIVMDNKEKNIEKKRWGDF